MMTLRCHANPAGANWVYIHGPLWPVGTQPDGAVLVCIGRVLWNFGQLPAFCNGLIPSEQWQDASGATRPDRDLSDRRLVYCFAWAAPHTGRGSHPSFMGLRLLSRRAGVAPCPNAAATSSSSYPDTSTRSDPAPHPACSAILR